MVEEMGKRMRKSSLRVHTEKSVMGLYDNYTALEGMTCRTK
jgi:hypothetical protein